jgi:hypothetical protein
MEHIFTIHEFKQASLLRFIITKRKIRNYEKYLEIALQRYVYDVSHKMDINTAFLTVVQDAELFDNAAALLKYFASVIDINDALCQIGQTVETFGLSIRNVEKVYGATRFLIMNGATDHKDINYDIVFRLLCNGVDVNDTNEYAALIKADKEKRCSCIEKYLDLFAMCDVHNIKNIITDYVEYEHNYNVDF